MKRFYLLTGTLALAAAAAQSASAQTIPILTLNEVSEGVLNWSWDGGGPSGSLSPQVGGPVPEMWTGSIGFPANYTIVGNPRVDGIWSEADGTANQINLLNFPGTSSLTVLFAGSDILNDGGPQLHNGAVVLSSDGSFKMRFLDHDSIPTLTLTEVSEGVLNWSWDGGGPSGSLSPQVGGPVPEMWTGSIGFPADYTIVGNPRVDGIWSEADGTANQINLLNFPGTSSLTVLFAGSDILNDGGPQLPDGGTVLASDGSFKMRYLDQADTTSTTVPDGGTTATLFGFSMMGVAALRRKLAV